MEHVEETRCATFFIANVGDEVKRTRNGSVTSLCVSKPTRTANISTA